MEKKEMLIKKYLQEKMRPTESEKSKSCPDNTILSDYLTNSLNQKERQQTEKHIAQCGFCLKQVGIAFEALEKRKKGFGPVPKKIIASTKASLGIGKNKKTPQGKRKRKKLFFLFATIIFFLLSFLVPRYFLQFLVGALILGIRWSFESESGKTLIMILDSWRKDSQSNDQEISNRLKDHLKK